MLLSLGSGSCMSPPDEHSYQLYPGPALPAGDVAVVRLGDASFARIDGLMASRSDWTEVKLRPGTHRIEWHAQTFDDWSGSDSIADMAHAMRALVVLEAGHTYSLRGSPISAIVDETTARPIAPQPWPDP